MKRFVLIESNDEIKEGETMVDLAKVKRLSAMGLERAKCEELLMFHENNVEAAIRAAEFELMGDGWEIIDKNGKKKKS